MYVDREAIIWRRHKKHTFTYFYISDSRDYFLKYRRFIQTSRGCLYGGRRLHHSPQVQPEKNFRKILKKKL